MLVRSIRTAIEDRHAALVAAAGTGRGDLAATSACAALVAGNEDLNPAECREVIVGDTNGCWVVIRQSGPRRLLCVMEVGQENLQGAADAANKFVHYNYSGLFDV